jgi:hypothetical protein
MGIIYEIICWTTGLRYIGKTTQTLKKRLSNHISRKKWYSSKLVIEHGNYEIYELEKVEDESLLTEREKYYIQRTDCVNIQIGDFNRTKYMKEYYQTEEFKKSNRERAKAFRERKKLEKSRLLTNDNT